MSRKPPPPGSECYACESPGTNWEHVPPKGLSPKEHEVDPTGARRFRDGLITVPSCALHNGAEKSNDDSYTVSVFVTVSALMNGVDRQRHRGRRFLEKHLTAFENGPRLRSTLETRSVVETPTGFQHKIDPNTDVLDRTVAAVARGLYYYERDWAERWVAPLLVCNNFASMSDPMKPVPFEAEMQALLRHLDEETEAGTLGVKGAPNPWICAYQLLDRDGMPRLMRIIFYGCLEYLVLTDPRASAATRT